MRQICPYLHKHITPEDTILDLGCGVGDIFPDLFYKKAVGVDIWKPYLEKANETFDSVIHHDIRKISGIVEQNSYDIVTMIDVIEHLTAEEGIKLIEDALRICRKKVIIYTPIKFIENINRAKGSWADDNNPYQLHKSRWPENIFTERGFTVEHYPNDTNIEGVLAIKTKNITPITDNIEEWIKKWDYLYQNKLHGYGMERYKVEKLSLPSIVFSKFIEHRGFRETDKVLEIGCGVGCIMETVFSYVDKLVGMDISKTAIEIAKTRFIDIPNVEFHARSDLEIFEDNYFDIVYSMAVFQHMPRYQTISYIKQIARVLKPKGYIVFQILLHKHGRREVSLTDFVPENKTPVLAYEMWEIPTLLDNLFVLVNTYFISVKYPTDSKYGWLIVTAVKK